MSDIRDKPLRVWAKLNGVGDPRWFVRRPDGTYDAFPPPDACGTPYCDTHHIEAHRLMPVRVDFAHDVGDNAAIVEIQNARNKHLARSK